jgi:Periplasmic component of the Tol biopolymer transport system
LGGKTLPREEAVLKNKLRAVKRRTSGLFNDVALLLRRVSLGREHYRFVDETRVTVLGVPGLHTFFGYYDISPFHADGTRLLACRVSAGSGTTPKRTPLQLGYYTLARTQQFFALATTDTWCWQQGARLQWAPCFGTEAVLFNRLSPEKLGADALVCLAGTGGHVSRYVRPVYSLHGQSGQALSLDFARLQRLRPGYGYAVAVENTPHIDAPEDDGIYFMRGPEQNAELIFSIKQAALLEPTPSMRGAAHYFNHLFWSPSGGRFMVIHAWHNQASGKHTRILTMAADGSQVRVLTFDDRASHYWWLTDDSLLVYGTLRGVSCYFRVLDTLGAESEACPALPQEDGHPSLSPNGNWLLGDTLPDTLSERSLWLYDQKNAKIHPLGYLYSPVSLRGETRCDLHPRWSTDGTLAAVDSAHAGTRQMLIVDVRALVGS